MLVTTNFLLCEKPPIGDFSGEIIRYSGNFVKMHFAEQCTCYPYIFPTIFPRAAAGRSLHKRLRNLYCCQSVRVRRNGGFACRVEGLEWNARYGSNGASSGNNDDLVVFSHHDFPPENVDLVRVYRIAGRLSIRIAGSWKSTGINLRKFLRRLASLFYTANVWQDLK